MASFTSHFKGRIPARAALWLALAAAAWALCVVNNYWFNPYIQVCVKGAEIKNQWADKMTREHGAKTVIFGGSSCAFSIDGERALERYQLPLVNDGTTAAFGAGVAVEFALGHCRPGPHEPSQPSPVERLAPQGQGRSEEALVLPHDVETDGEELAGGAVLKLVVDVHG